MWVADLGYGAYGLGDGPARIVTVCDGGGNGTFTAATLQELGYQNVATLEGGFYGWVGAGLPVVT